MLKLKGSFKSYKWGLRNVIQFALGKIKMVSPWAKLREQFLFGDY